MLRIGFNRFACSNTVRIRQNRSDVIKVRSISTITRYDASHKAKREVPTPLVFLSASRWDNHPEANKRFKLFTKYFTSKGWNVYCIDLDPFEGKNSIKGEEESSKILQKLELELIDQMQKLSGGEGGAGPFPPLLVSYGLPTLIAEMYVSSNPLSGLALINPPLNPIEAQKVFKKQLPTQFSAFTYEPRFPCLVAWNSDRAQTLTFWQIHRIEQIQEDEADEALERNIWDLSNSNEEKGAGPFELKTWAEDNGIIPKPEIKVKHERKEEATESNAEEEEVNPEEEEDVAINFDEPNKLDEVSPQLLRIPKWYTNGNYIRNKVNKKDPLILDDKHIIETFIRGSGPGGQAINKLSTCVQLKHIPTKTVVRCQESRSRSQNRKLARRKLGKELEILIFGFEDSVLGKEILRERQSKRNKEKKRKRKKEEKEREKREENGKGAQETEKETEDI